MSGALISYGIFLAGVLVGFFVAALLCAARDDVRDDMSGP